MEPKVGLNNTQRKMLDTICTQGIEKRAKAYQRKRDDERKELVESEQKKIQESKEFKEFAKLYDLIKKKEQDYKSKGFYITREDDKLKIKMNSYSYDGYPLAIQVFDKETRDTYDKIEERTIEVRSRIYGMDTSYDEVNKELQDMFNFLDI